MPAVIPSIASMVCVPSALSKVMIAKRSPALLRRLHACYKRTHTTYTAVNQRCRYDFSDCYNGQTCFTWSCVDCTPNVIPEEIQSWTAAKGISVTMMCIRTALNQVQVMPVGTQIRTSAKVLPAARTFRPRRVSCVTGGG